MYQESINNFKMNLENILLNTILVVLCIIPFILMGRFQQRRKNQLLKSLEALASEQNAHITQKEFCGNIVIGLDENKNLLFFFKQNNADNSQIAKQVIDLSKVSNCRIINTSKSVKTKEGNNTTIEKLELDFSYTADNEPNTILEFYDKEEKWQLSGEVQLIEKWEKLLKPRIKALV